MLLIETKKRKPINWTFDSEKPFPSVKIQDIQLLHADSKELEIILEGFKNIPCTTALGTQVWTDAWARQIYANLLPLVQERQTGVADNAGTGPMEET